MKTYQLSATGRRTTLLLLVGALAIWGFALWSFRSTLELSLVPHEFWASLQANFEPGAEGLSFSRLVPALLMLVLIVATPLLVWNLLEEWAASYTVTDAGVDYRSLGIRLLIPWDGIAAIRPLDDDSEDPIDELLLRQNYARQIGNPLLRWLHTQAYGRRKLPIYAGLHERDELLREIRQRVAQAEQARTTNNAPAKAHS